MLVHVLSSYPEVGAPLLQLGVHVLCEAPALRDLLAQGVVVLDQPQDVGPVAAGPQPVARHQAGRGARGPALGAAAAQLLGAVILPPPRLCTQADPPCQLKTPWTLKAVTTSDGFNDSFP